MDRYQVVQLAVPLAAALILANGCGQTQPPVPGPDGATAPHTIPARDATATIVLLDAAEARRQATVFINRKLRGHTSRAPTGEVVWRPVSGVIWHSVIYNYRNHRIELRMGGSGGWEAMVTMGPNGDSPKVEHVEFAWD